MLITQQGIYPNLRAKITWNDAKIIQKILPDLDDEEQISPNFVQGELSLLDSDKLYNYIVATSPLRKLSPSVFYYVIVRHFLLKHNVKSMCVAEYISELLEEFSKGKRSIRIATYDDQEYSYLIDLYQDMMTNKTHRCYLLASHLGNFSLWKAGLFPESLTSNNQLSYYDSMGQIGYKVAAVHPISKSINLIDTFDELVDNYTMIRQSLNSLRESVHFST